jgi:flagellar assembly factor FliW
MIIVFSSQASCIIMLIIKEMPVSFFISSPFILVVDYHKAINELLHDSNNI